MQVSYTDNLIQKLKKARTEVEQHELLSQIEWNKKDLTEYNKIELSNWMTNNPGVVIKSLLA